MNYKITNTLEGTMIFSDNEKVTGFNWLRRFMLSEKNNVNTNALWQLVEALDGLKGAPAGTTLFICLSKAETYTGDTFEGLNHTFELMKKACKEYPNIEDYYPDAHKCWCIKKTAKQYKLARLGYETN